jgi:hypothetical protein
VKDIDVTNHGGSGSPVRSTVSIVLRNNCESTPNGHIAAWKLIQPSNLLANPTLSMTVIGRSVDTSKLVLGFFVPIQLVHYPNNFDRMSPVETPRSFHFGRNHASEFICNGIGSSAEVSGIA